MRIIFFGTSHGVPEPNHQCSCTLVEIGQRRYFIDMGMMAIPELIKRNIPVESVQAVFTTHSHGDHINALPAFMDLISWNYKNANPTLCLADGKIYEAARVWHEAVMTPTRDFKMIEINVGEIYRDDTLTVTAYHNHHLGEKGKSYSFLLEAQGKRVLFTGDLSSKGPADDFPIEVFAEPVAAVICESAHFPAQAYSSILKDEINFFIAPRRLESLPAGIKTEVIYRENLYLVTSPGCVTEDMLIPENPQVIDLRKMKNRDFILLKKGHANRKRADEVLKEYGIIPNVLMEVSSCISAVQLADSGLGSTIVPARALEVLGGKEKFCCYQYSEESDGWDVNVIYKEEVYLDRAERYLIELMKEVFTSQNKIEQK